MLPGMSLQPQYFLLFLNVLKLLTFQRGMVHGQTIRYKKILQNVEHIWA